MRELLSYDDVLIEPGYSEIRSRENVKTNTKVCEGLELDIPIISAPMDTVTEVEMAVAMGELGGLGVIHRFCSIEEQKRMVGVVKAAGYKVGAAVGIVNDYKDRILELASEGVDLFVIDVAHGDHKLAYKTVEHIKGSYKIPVMLGSIATYPAAERAIQAGADCLRVGVGGGSFCTTRINAGVGVPQFTAVDHCVNDVIPVCADGGIRFGGDIAKALGIGATTVMCGGLLSGTDESPGRIITTGFGDNEKRFKEYRGMASQNAKASNGREIKHVEGMSGLKPYRDSVKPIIEQALDGLRSAMSYVGASNLEEYRENFSYVRVTPTANHLRKI